MHIVIEDETVRSNIQSFIEILKRAEARRERNGASLIEKSHKVFIHRITGKLIFSDLFKDHLQLQDKEWKTISLDYYYDSQTESFQAVAYDGSNQLGAFELDDLKPLACKILKQTVTLLNEMSSLLKGPGSDLVTKIKAICKLSIDGGNRQKDKNVIFSTWHSLDRLGAEKLLSNKPVGSYFFREDPFAKILEAQLGKQFEQEVRCVTLTILSDEKKVSDFTIVHMNHCWTLYEDCLFCNGRVFDRIEDLLQTCFPGDLKYPLYQR